MKKIIAVVLILVMVAALSIGGTIAYLMDDDYDVNTMTMHDVYIEQIEQERDANGDLVPFTQNKPAYPAVYEGTSIPYADAADWIVPNDEAWKVVRDNENVVDKFVTVKNTGSTGAYVRTIMAFEVGANGVNDPYMHLVVNLSNVTDKPTWSMDWLSAADVTKTVEMDGQYYHIYVFTYEGVLEPGETTIPNLKQTYLDKTATNEVCRVYGETFDILLLSQGVQAAGFSDPATALNTAFGEVTNQKAEQWFNEILHPGSTGIGE